MADPCKEKREMSEQKLEAMSVEQIAKLAVRGCEVKTLNDPRPGVDHALRHFLVVPDGHEVVNLESFLPQGVFTARCARIDDVQDFIAYVNRYAMQDTSVYFDRANKEFKAVIDHDLRGKHRVVCKLQTTEVFDAWAAASGVYKSQDDFADWLEENEMYILEPAAASVLEAVRSLRLSSKVEFQRVVNEASGAISFLYEDELRQSGRIELPATVIVPLQIFRGSPCVSVGFLLRYRLNAGKVVLCVKAPKLKALMVEAMDQVFDIVEEQMAPTCVYRGCYAQ
jgi:uncharacterized protein YfdQ (DUF2303 family)